MIRLCLPADEQDRLRHLFRTTDDRTLRDRLPIILMAPRGRPHQDLATDLGITPRAAQRWPNASPGHGTDGLRPRQAKGAAPS